MRTIIAIGLFLLLAASISSKNVLSFEKIKFLEGMTEKQSFHLPGDFLKVGNISRSINIFFLILILGDSG